MTEPKVVHEWSNRRLMEHRNHPDYRTDYIKRWVEYRVDHSDGSTEWVEDKHPGNTTLGELARLAARVQELEEEREDFMALPTHADVTLLEAENTRLREALEKITEISAKDSGYLDYARWQMMLTEARQALKEKP